jgi:hypothetical protein
MAVAATLISYRQCPGRTPARRATATRPRQCDNLDFGYGVEDCVAVNTTVAIGRPRPTDRQVPCSQRTRSIGSFGRVVMSHPLDPVWACLDRVTSRRKPQVTFSTGIRSGPRFRARVYARRNPGALLCLSSSAISMRLPQSRSTCRRSPCSQWPPRPASSWPYSLALRRWRFSPSSYGLQYGQRRVDAMLH